MNLRSLRSQFGHAINRCVRTGSKKDADKKSGVKKEQPWRLYSNERIRQLRDIAYQFSNWYRDNHDGWKILLSNITAEDWQQFIEYKQLSEDWSIKTTRGRIDVIQKLACCVNHAFRDCQVDWSGLEPLEIRMEPVKINAMERQDYEMLSVALSNTRSKGRDAADIGIRVGLRIDEIAHLKAERINIDEAIIEVREGAKNDRDRDVPIRLEHLVYFENLKSKIGTGYVTGGILADSINAHMRRQMKKLISLDGTGRSLDEKYPCETEHAIRKAYARERMAEERIKGKSERCAWNIVCDELGHGEDRKDLYATYIGRPSEAI